MLGAERGDEQAVAWLREAARAASAQSPLVAVELVRHAEALLPGGHPGADQVSVEVVGALLRAGKVAEASARAEACSLGSMRRRWTPRCALPSSARWLSRTAPPSSSPSHRPASSVRRSFDPFERVPLLAHQSWALTFSGDHRGGESAALRAVVVAEEAGGAAMTVWALTALLIAIGRQGRFREALAHARRAAALGADPEGRRALPLQPNLFLGLALFDCDLVGEARAAYRAALDDEFGTGWFLSDTLVAGAQAAFAIGQWDDAVPGLIASGQAALEKNHMLLLSQSLAHRAIIATAVGDPARQICSWGSSRRWRATTSVTTRGVRASAVAGWKEAEGDEQGAYDVLLRCWRFQAARDDRFYDRCVAPDLVRLALALGDRDIAAEVASTVVAGVALAPDVPTVRSVALRYQGLVEGDVERLIEAVAVARETPLMVEHTGACEGAARLLARSGRRDEAVALLAEALELHERAGAEAWAGRVRAQLGPLASVLGGEGRGTGRRAAGGASRRPRGRCRCSWPRD